MSLFGDDLRAFCITVWHSINFVDGRVKPKPHFVFGTTRVLRVELIGSSSH